MKDAMDSTAARRAMDPAAEGAPDATPAPVGTDFANRRLIRPYVPRDGNRDGNRSDFARDRGAGGPRKPATTPEQTHAENFYYQKQMQSRTTMVIVLKDGEEIQGWIEWYDRNCIKVNRSNQPNLLIYKLNIKYMYKAGENQRR